MSRRVRVLLITVVSALLLAGPAQAPAQERASLPDIEDEVMCTICGTLLEESQSPQADRERALIRRLIAQGKTKQEIKDALVAQYGEQVLATQGTSGFDLFAWLVPGLAIAAGLGAAVALVLRRRGAASDRPAPAKLDSSDLDELDRDMSSYDL